MSRPRTTDGPPVLSVTELNALGRTILEQRAPDVWVEGEVRDLVHAASGHLYFVLADARAQIRATMFRSDAQRLRYAITEGMRLRVRGGLTVYEARGSFQLTVRAVLVAGEGERALELAKLRKKLAEEGLLDPQKKRPLPRFPRTVGLVTSRDGAALRDIVKVALDRFPARLVLVHAPVQGVDAPLGIVRALAWVQKLRTLDVVILARGGGASEDLAAFDDERVARAVAACRVPIVTGVGHEIDVTLADLCADVRAATPSNAAELVVPSLPVVTARLETLERALERALDHTLDASRMRLERLAKRLADPRRKLRDPRGQLALHQRALERAAQKRVRTAREQLAELRARLERHDPRAQLAADRARLGVLQTKLEALVRQHLERDRFERRAARERLVRASLALEPALRRLLAERRHALGRERASLEAEVPRHVAAARHALAQHGRALHALSPLAVLERGYAIALDRATGKAVTDAREAPPGSELTVRLHRGELDVVVK